MNHILMSMNGEMNLFAIDMYMEVLRLQAKLWIEIINEKGFKNLLLLNFGTGAVGNDYRQTLYLQSQEDHPIVWYNSVGDGRTFYSAMGHQAMVFEDPDHLKMLENATRWAGRFDE